MIKSFHRILKVLGIIWGCVILMNYSLKAAVIVVNSTADDPAVSPSMNALTLSGAITLRSAIEYANSIGGSNSINFNISGTGPFTIFVGTGAGVAGQALPLITNQLSINGYTQSGSSRATSTNHATIQVILNGSAIATGSFKDGLTMYIGSSNSVITGLVIQGFPGNGIAIQSGSGQSVLGNYIGTNQSGTVAVPNLGNGIYIGLNASLVSVGSSTGVGTVGNRNIISGQEFLMGAYPVSGVGVFIEGQNNQVTGNYIGTDVSGADALPNRTGVYVLESTPTVALNNTIQGNIIAFNNGTGAAEGSGIIIDGTDNNSLVSNSIYDNVGNGITLLHNGNENLTAPTLTSATISSTTLQVNGTISATKNPNSSFIIQFFTNPTTGLTTQGQTFLGHTTLTTDAKGNGAFTNVLLFSNAVVGQFVSATITLLSGTGTPLSTSPYSLNFVLAQGQTSGSIDTLISFATFPGIRAQSVVVDSLGRVIVGGLGGSIVRYTTAGVIDITYQNFPGTAVKAMVIDSANNIIAVGTEGYVVKYNSAGTITSTFTAFPGVLANAVIFDATGNIIVGGLQSTIVRYSNFGTNQGKIITTFSAFPGTAVNGLALAPGGQIIACGLQGQVASYTAAGLLSITYDPFPGLAANAITVDSSGRAIVVGKTQANTTTVSTIGIVPVITPVIETTSFNQVPSTTITSLTNVVRYNTDGGIELTFAAFAGLNAQDVILDLNSNIVVCGLGSLVVQYNPSSGSINTTFAAFPGINTTWLALTSANQVVAVGWEGEVVRYYN